MTITGVIALVPARSGSRRLPGKNIRPLQGHPLIAYTISAALQSQAFERVIVSTDDETTAGVAVHYGAEVPFLRPASMAMDLSSDMEWVEHAIGEIRKTGYTPRAFALLRPTSPLRQPRTIRDAVSALLADETADSVRAVQLVREHPGKMWIMKDAEDRIVPLLDDGGMKPPWHSSPYQSLPRVYVQNASLEVAWVRTVDRTGTIAGASVRPWICPGYEGLDINEEADWKRLEDLLNAGQTRLPIVAASAVGMRRTAGGSWT